MIRKDKQQGLIGIATLVVFLLAMVKFTDSKLIIQSPPQLQAQLQTLYPDGIPYSIANYGDVPFGKTLTGNLYMPRFLDNCEYEPIEGADDKINKIIISTRGDCSFTAKSINSQKQGAKLAIIADNVQYEDPGSIVMVDDGKGQQVKIPTILINHEVGSIITQYMLTKKTQVSLTLSLPTQKKAKATLSLWLSAFDRKSYIMVRQLQPYLKLLQSSITLQLHHPTTACSSCPETDCYGDKQYCINTGFYGYAIEGYGRELINQQLREELILQQWPDKIWDYLDKFDQQCGQRNAIAQCSDQVLKSIGINPGQVNQQVMSSFVNRTSQNGSKILDHPSLKKNNDLRYSSGIIVFPAIMVNNLTYRGNLDPLDIFQLVCQSLDPEPESCNLDPKPKKGSILGYILAATIIMVVVISFLFFCYRRQARREITNQLNKEVNQLVNQYITMYETQRFEQGNNGDPKSREMRDISS